MKKLFFIFLFFLANYVYADFPEKLVDIDYVSTMSTSSLSNYIYQLEKDSLVTRNGDCVLYEKQNPRPQSTFSICFSEKINEKEMVATLSFRANGNAAGSFVIIKRGNDLVPFPKENLLRLEFAPPEPGCSFYMIDMFNKGVFFSMSKNSNGNIVSRMYINISDKYIGTNISFEFRFAESRSGKYVTRNFEMICPVCGKEILPIYKAVDLGMSVQYFESVSTEEITPIVFFIGFGVLLESANQILRMKVMINTDELGWPNVLQGIL